MIGTYAATLAVCGASLAIGSAVLVACGIRLWSWLSPAVGLALLCAICWALVRAPGGGTTAALALGLLVVASLWFLRGRLEGGGEALPMGAVIALLALAAASLPFVVEGHFGILGTGFNPDMSQHLLATARLAEGHGFQLLHQGYPLGPHAIVATLDDAFGIGLVQAFSGLTVAVAVLASLTALTAFAPLARVGRGSSKGSSERTAALAVAAALVVGLAYVVASYLAQGAFKETMQALFLLAFVLALREADRNPDWAGLSLRYVPAALIAVGSVYVYSFPGLIWLAATTALWLVTQLALAKVAPRALGLALLTFLVLAAPEIGRMADFHSFETFDPNGPGLGNLFGQVSPFEALGIWPSGDFRLAPGDGAVPALGYYLGIAFALALLLHGIWRCARRREVAILAGLAAAALAYVAARLAGTPYTAAKAIEVAAPLCALVILLPLLLEAERRGAARPREGLGTDRLAAGAATVFVAAAGLCSLLALANAPVGPTSYSPALTGLRPLLGEAPTLVLASNELLEEQHGASYLAWELRGGRVCIGAREEAGDAPPPGVRFVVAAADRQPPFTGLRRLRVAPPFVLWEVEEPRPGKSPCPLIAVRQPRQGPAR